MADYTRAISVLREHEQYAVQTLNESLHNPASTLEQQRAMLEDVHNFRAAVGALEVAGSKVDFNALARDLTNGSEANPS